MLKSPDLQGLKDEDSPRLKWFNSNAEGVPSNDVSPQDRANTSPNEGKKFNIMLQKAMSKIGSFDDGNSVKYSQAIQDYKENLKRTGTSLKMSNLEESSKNQADLVEDHEVGMNRAATAKQGPKPGKDLIENIVDSFGTFTNAFSDFGLGKKTVVQEETTVQKSSFTPLTEKKKLPDDLFSSQQIHVNQPPKSEEKLPEPPIAVETQEPTDAHLLSSTGARLTDTDKQSADRKQPEC